MTATEVATAIATPPSSGIAISTTTAFRITLMGVPAAATRREFAGPLTWENPRSGMSVIKSLWASVQGDPLLMRRVNGWLTIFWIAMIPVSILTGWINSVTYVAALSLWALVSGHWSAWQGARVEVEQTKEAEMREKEDLPGEVAQRVIDALQAQQVSSRPASS